MARMPAVSLLSIPRQTAVSPRPFKNSQFSFIIAFSGLTTKTNSSPKRVTVKYISTQWEIRALTHKKPVQCPARTAPTNGAVSPTGAVSYPNGVTFTCNTGYVLNGAAATTCQADGTWSNPVPTCTPVQCPVLTAPANGAVSPTGAVFYPSSVSFTCNPGYQLIGFAAATCQPDGTWSNLAPTCTPIQCPTRTAPANGAVSPTGAVSYPNGVTFTCNPGYVLNGAAAATCQADGTWSDIVPTCTENQCPTLTVPTNGALSTTLTSYQTVVTFICHTGYVLNGDSNTTCQADGTWSNPVPTCTPVQCPILTDPTNGMLRPTGVISYPNSVSFTCNTGYQLIGFAAATCQADGTWSNSVPTCTPIQCPTLPTPTNGAVSPTGVIAYPNSVSFKCNTGYQLNGFAAATCQADGTWSNPVPTCTAVQCPTLIAPTNGAVSPTGAVSYPNGVTFTCNTGYVLNGAAAATCQADGTWSNPVPTCTPNGALSTTVASYQTVVSFICNTGYVRNGFLNTTCQADGTWTNPVPTCTPVQCPNLIAPTNGAVSPTGAIYYPSSVTFTCYTGYRLRGFSAATCQADGTWSNPVPTCTPVRCPALTAPTNGAVSPTGAVSYPNGVTFTCNTGYVLNGAAASTCQADGTWSNPVPTCTLSPDTTTTAFATTTNATLGDPVTATAGTATFGNTQTAVRERTTASKITTRAALGTTSTFGNTNTAASSATTTLGNTITAAPSKATTFDNTTTATPTTKETFDNTTIAAPSPTTTLKYDQGWAEHNNDIGKYGHCYAKHNNNIGKNDHGYAKKHNNDIAKHNNDIGKYVQVYAKHNNNIGKNDHGYAKKHNNDIAKHNNDIGKYDHDHGYAKHNNNIGKYDQVYAKHNNDNGKYGHGYTKQNDDIGKYDQGYAKHKNSIVKYDHGYTKHNNNIGKYDKGYAKHNNGIGCTKHNNVIGKYDQGYANIDIGKYDHGCTKHNNDIGDYNQRYAKHNNVIGKYGQGYTNNDIGKYDYDCAKDNSDIGKYEQICADDNNDIGKYDQDCDKHTNDFEKYDQGYAKHNNDIGKHDQGYANNDIGKYDYGCAKDKNDIGKYEQICAEDNNDIEKYDHGCI
ncbi:hypothetical protein Bbelb_240750 [Branchiostoma belcheri]|nr:hypothetical protein Bbelb_240750 [Branchiostoma belcheri]